MTEDEFKQQIVAIAQRISTDVLADLSAAHRDYGWNCAAHSEGQTCCTDLLVGDDPTPS